MTGTLVIAETTLREAARKRLVWVALLVGAAFLLIYAAGLHYAVRDINAKLKPLVQRQAFNMLLIMGLYCVNLMAVMMAVLTSVDTLSGEIASGTIHAIASKPLRRWEIVLGKWLGYVAMQGIYIALMFGGTVAIVYFSSGYAPRRLVPGACLVWLEASILVSLTLLGGSRFTTLTNGVLALGMHGLGLLGGWMEYFGAMTQSPTAANVGVLASVLAPTDVLWRRAAHEMASVISRELAMAPFVGPSIPSNPMLVYAGIYLAAVLFAAVRAFARRDL